MTYRDVYYALEKEYIDPFRGDAEIDDDDITCYDAWHNMRHMSPCEIFESVAHEETHGSGLTIIRWDDEAPTRMAKWMEKEFKLIVEELTEV